MEHLLAAGPAWRLDDAPGNVFKQQNKELTITPEEIWFELTACF
jgi:hypothetical protein